MFYALLILPVLILAFALRSHARQVRRARWANTFLAEQAVSRQYARRFS